MQINFKAGFIYAPNTNKYINPQHITNIKDAKHVSYVGLSDNQFVSVNAPASKIASACIKAQTENCIINIDEYQEND